MPHGLLSQNLSLRDVKQVHVAAQRFEGGESGFCFAAPGALLCSTRRAPRSGRPAADERAVFDDILGKERDYRRVVA